MFKLIIFIILLFILLNQFNNIDKKHEEFENILRENFENSKNNEVIDIKNLVKEESYNIKTNEKESENNNESKNNKDSDNTDNNSEKDNLGENKKENSKCKGKEKECLFGCPKDKINILENNDEKRDTNVEEMIVTIEDTEKLCNLIEKKDKERLEREEKENMKKQIELNKRFLIQQKAQNKQIEDLEKIIKEMTFTQEMNEVGIEKCGVGADQCLTDKEKELIELMKTKKKNKKEVKINLNLENFGKILQNEIRQKLKLDSNEINNLYNGVREGKINAEDLNNQIFNSLSSDYDNTTNNRKLPKPKIKYVKNACKKCKIDLSEYIDRCKIPCYKCRDPSWNCPQDMK